MNAGGYMQLAEQNELFKIMMREEVMVLHYLTNCYRTTS